MPAFLSSRPRSADKHLPSAVSFVIICAPACASKPGEVLRLTDGQRRRYQARVTAVTPQTLTAEILDCRLGQTDTAPGVLLAQPLLKGDHMDWVVQKAASWACAQFCRSSLGHRVVRPQPEQVSLGRSLAASPATEAAQQSEQWQPPRVLIR